MSTAITPTYIQNFETNLTYRMANAWARTLKRLWWMRLMNTQTTGGILEYIEWMLESARIMPAGPQGASVTYDPLVAISQTLEHDHFGNGLKLFRPDTDTGGAQAYWPQRLLVNMIQNGKSATLLGKDNRAYDGKVFFATDHPINPYDASQSTYSNLHVGTTFTAQNLARVVAYIESIKHAGDAPNGAPPTIVVVPTNWRFRAQQALNAESYTDVITVTSTAAAAASNTFKAAYEFEPPIIAPELNSEPDVWYVGVPADEDAFDSSFIYVERQPFEVNSYSPMSQVELARINTFEWINKGRNGGAYGHPYRFHRCESSGSQASYLSDLDL
jgi:hypothetical protein